VIFVRDNGIGLSPDSMRTVFDMFTRIESEIGRSEGGLGVGLALAKGLIELHGGKMRVSSAGLGQGSEFMIYLPCTLIVRAQMPASVDSEDGSIPPMARRVLVADDNQDSATTLGLLLEGFGHEVHLAHSGKETLALAKQVRPDIGIFDIGMPDLSGYTVAERIRHEAWGTEMTLIAVTGWGQESDRRRALAAGFDHHLTKPVDPDQLEALLRRNRRDRI
jgi:CheY-like chemotaxis protein